MDKPETFCTHDFGVCVSARFMVADNCNTLAAMVRAREAIEDGERNFALTILDQLIDELAAMNEAVSNMVKRFDAAT